MPSIQRTQPRRAAVGANRAAVGEALDRPARLARGPHEADVQRQQRRRPRGRERDAATRRRNRAQPVRRVVERDERARRDRCAGRRSSRRTPCRRHATLSTRVAFDDRRELHRARVDRRRPRARPDVRSSCDPSPERRGPRSWRARAVARAWRAARAAHCRHATPTGVVGSATGSTALSPAPVLAIGAWPRRPRRAARRARRALRAPRSPAAVVPPGEVTAAVRPRDLVRRSRAMWPSRAVSGSRGSSRCRAETLQNPRFDKRFSHKEDISGTGTRKSSNCIKCLLIDAYDDADRAQQLRRDLHVFRGCVRPRRNGGRAERDQRGSVRASRARPDDRGTSASMVAIVTPAAMETTRVSARNVGNAVSRVAATSPGLTAMTTTSVSATAQAALGTTRTLTNCRSSAARRSASISAMESASASQPASSSPPINAAPIFPPPSSATRDIVARVTAGRGGPRNLQEQPRTSPNGADLPAPRARRRSHGSTAEQCNTRQL